LHIAVFSKTDAILANLELSYVQLFNTVRKNKTTGRFLKGCQDWRWDLHKVFRAEL
jgi:hypothetical protein